MERMFVEDDSISHRSVSYTHLYTYKLHSGKTVIQYIYDSHYEGAAQAAELVREWATLEGKIDQPLYEQMRDRDVYKRQPFSAAIKS